MKKFEFSLETVLNVREEKVKAAQKELKEVEEQVAALKARVSEVEGEMKGAEQEIVHLQNGTSRSEDMLGRYAYLRALKSTLAALQEEGMKLQNVLHSKRVALMEAQKEKEVIEKLKDKRYQAWKKSLERKELQFLDEIATLRYNGSPD